MTAPGWYHATGDPEGTQRYWDGNQWVGEPRSAAPQPAPPPQPPPAPGAPQGFASPAAGSFPGGGAPAGSSSGSNQLDKRWAFGAIGAAVLAIIGTFGPWASFLGVSLNGIDSDDGKLTLGAAIIAGIAAVAAIVQPAGRRAIRIVYGLCGALVLFVFLGNYSDISDIGTGWGFWVIGLCGIAMLALAIVGDRFLPKS